MDNKARIALESGAWRRDAGCDEIEKVTELRELSFGEPVAEALIEGDDLLQERREQLLAGGRELDLVDAAIRRVAPAGHEPRGFHLVQVVGEGWALDADLFGDLALGAVCLALERDKDEPDRQRPAGLGERVVEGSAHQLRGTAQLQSDRLDVRCGHAMSLRHQMLRYQSVADTSFGAG